MTQNSDGTGTNITKPRFGSVLGSGLIVIAFLVATCAIVLLYQTDKKLEAAELRLEAAIQNQDAALSQLDGAENRARLILSELERYDEFRVLIDLTEQIRFLNEELISLDESLGGQPTPGLNKPDTLSARSEQLDWISQKVEELQAEEQRLDVAIEAIRNWRMVRLEAAPASPCRPQNPFRPGASGGCRTDDEGPSDGGGNRRPD